MKYGQAMNSKAARISAVYAHGMLCTADLCALTISLMDWAGSCFNFMDNVTFSYPTTSRRDLMVMNPRPLANLMPSRSACRVVECEMW